MQALSNKTKKYLLITILLFTPILGHTKYDCYTKLRNHLDFQDTGMTKIVEEPLINKCLQSDPEICEIFLEQLKFADFLNRKSERFLLLANHEEYLEAYRNQLKEDLAVSKIKIDQDVEMLKLFLRAGLITQREFDMHISELNKIEETYQGWAKEATISQDRLFSRCVDQGIISADEYSQLAESGLPVKELEKYYQHTQQLTYQMFSGTPLEAEIE